MVKCYWVSSRCDVDEFSLYTAARVQPDHVMFINMQVGRNLLR